MNDIQLQQYTLNTIGMLATQTACMAAIDGIVNSDILSNERKILVIQTICEIANKKSKR